MCIYIYTHNNTHNNNNNKTTGRCVFCFFCLSCFCPREIDRHWHGQGDYVSTTVVL